MARETIVVATLIILGLAIGSGGFIWFWKSKRPTCNPTLSINFTARQVKFYWYCKGFLPPSGTKESCDANNPCPEGRECYKFPDEEKPICWEGDPCEKCESKKCMTTLSYPPSVICQD